MSVFEAYAKYYNLLYREKDYIGEARYIHHLIQEHSPGAKSILDLGCGTGRHDIEFANLGYDVTGVDRSDEMLIAAKKNTLPSDSKSFKDAHLAVNFLSGDIRSVRLDRTFDVIVSLFHVMSYQITNADLQSVFSTVKTHLNPGGLFLFDCWYGPAVLTNPPVLRIKRLADAECDVLRIAEPAIRYNDNVVDVNYQVMVTDKRTGKVENMLETHQMRYLFMPEIDSFAHSKNLRKIFAYEWMGLCAPTAQSWGVLVGFCG